MPEGWNNVDLLDLLSYEQFQKVAQIMRSYRDDMKVTRKLREYFHSIAGELEAKGLLPDYAAYAIPYFLNQYGLDRVEQAYRQRQQQPKPQPQSPQPQQPPQQDAEGHSAFAEGVVRRLLDEP